MQLGSYRITLAAAVFKVSCLVKMTSRSMNSIPNVTQEKLVAPENGGTPPLSWNRSEDVFNEEFPLLSSSRSISTNKRRTRVDLLGSHPEQKSAVNVEYFNPPDIEPLSTFHENDSPLPTSLGQQFVNSASRSSNPRDTHDNSLLPTRFGKRPVTSASRSFKSHETHTVHRESKRMPIFNDDEPFDICLLETDGGPDIKMGTWQAKMNNDLESSVEDMGFVVRPGMILLKSYIPLNQQVEILKKCRELGSGTGGFYCPSFSNGAKLHLYMMCLGLDWNVQTREYGKRRFHDDNVPPDIPHEFMSLVGKVLDASHTLIKRDMKTINVEDVLPRISPDVCIVNFYNTNGRLGLHQDRDESKESLMKGLPVVSLSIGDSAEFLYGDERDINKAESLLLESGDVLVFGGESRHIFHGVTTIHPNTAPDGLREISKLRPGRLNLTFRKY